MPQLQVPPVLPSSQLRDQAVQQLRRQRGVLRAPLMGRLMQAPPPSRVLRRLQRSCSMQWQTQASLLSAHHQLLALASRTAVTLPR